MDARVPIPQLQALAARRGVSLADIAGALGMTRSAFHELRKHPLGIARHHAEAIATYLGVPVAVLSAPAVAMAGADDATAAMLATPEVAAVRQRAMDAAGAAIEEAVAHAVTATLRLIADGTVSLPALTAPVRKPTPAEARAAAAAVPAPPARRRRAQ